MFDLFFGVLIGSFFGSFFGTVGIHLVFVRVFHRWPMAGVGSAGDQGVPVVQQVAAVPVVAVVDPSPVAEKAVDAEPGEFFGTQPWDLPAPSVGRRRRRDID